MGGLRPAGCNTCHVNGLGRFGRVVILEIEAFEYEFGCEIVGKCRDFAHMYTLLDLPLVLYDPNTTYSHCGVAEEFSRLEGLRGEVERVEMV